MKNTSVGQQVVRSKGDYVVGRVGNVITIDDEKQRAQVDWGSVKTWVSFGSLELTSTPYEIVNHKYQMKPAEQFETKKVMYNGKEYDAINFGAL